MKKMLEIAAEALEMAKLLRIVKGEGWGYHEIVAEALEMARFYLPSAYGGFKNKKLFKDIERYCMFIGYPRSGHSLIGALLDAHPNMIIAHELHTLKHIYSGFSKRQIYYLLLKNSRTFAKAGREWSGYSYKVPNQWQGVFKKLQVIGDNKGEGSLLRLRSNPRLLQRLQSNIGIKIKFIHIIRNPYDNISTISKKSGRRKLDIKESVDHYFSLCETVASIKKRIEGDDLFELRHETFIDDPKTYLKKLCHILGVDASNDYLNDCASIVFRSPHKSRHDTEWSCELIDRVKLKIDKFPFLQGYSYED